MSIPEEGIQAAVEVMRSGRLFRYSCKSAERSQVALAEREFAEATGARFALGVNSCSSAILIALLSVGVHPGDEVLTNAFTFTAIPSTILRLGAEPVLVECNNRWRYYSWRYQSSEKDTSEFPQILIIMVIFVLLSQLFLHVEDSHRFSLDRCRRTR